MEYRTLCNGYKIPCICYGTDIVDYKVSSIEKLKQKMKIVVKSALRRDTRKMQRDKGIINCLAHSLENKCNFLTHLEHMGSLKECLVIC